MVQKLVHQIYHFTKKNQVRIVMISSQRVRPICNYIVLDKLEGHFVPYEQCNKLL